VAYEQCALIGCHSMLAPFRSVGSALDLRAAAENPCSASCHPGPPPAPLVSLNHLPFASFQLKAAWAQLGIALLMAEFHRTKVQGRMTGLGSWGLIA